MRIKRLFVVTMWAQDVEATAYFYRDVIGLPILPHHGSRPHFKVGDSLITILRSETPTTQTGQSIRFPCLALETDKLDEAVQRLEMHNVEMPWGIEQDADSRWVMFYDVAGNLVEIAETFSWE